MDQSKIKTGKYRNQKYNKKERFINYWYQINSVLSYKPHNVLEIGIGSGFVYYVLGKWVKEIKSLDINKELKPDILGSVTNIPIKDNKYDVVLCAEVLEHLPFESFSKSLSEIYRVSKKGAVISIPNNGATFSASLKIPMIKWIHLVFKVPYFWKKKTMTEEHFWEVGLSGYPLSKIKKEMKKVGFTIEKTFIPYDDTYRMFFILKK